MSLISNTYVSYMEAKIKLYTDELQWSVGPALDVEAVHVAASEMSPAVP